MFDTIIIGAGIIGTTLARGLAKKGQSVLVLERRTGPGLEASGASVGILSYAPSQNRPIEWHCLAKDAVREHRRLAGELSQECPRHPEWHWPGRLNIALTEKAGKKLKKAFEKDNENGALSRWLDQIALREHEPNIAPDALGGERLDDCGWVDAVALTRAAEQAAQSFGAVFQYGTSVRNVIVKDNVAGGVSLESGEEKYAGHVVIAAGTWSHFLDPGGKLVIEPVKGQALTITKPGIGRIKHIVFGNGVYLVSQDRGLTVGATHEHVGFDAQVTEAGIQQLVTKASALFKNVSGCGPGDITAWAGLRPATLDRIPVLGPSMHTKNLWWATGHFSHGILLAPLTARLLAAAIADNQIDGRFTAHLKNV